MGGEIRAASVAGQGSVFSFTARFGLPPAGTAAMPARAPALASAEVHFDGARVLLVDDNPTNLLVAQEYLSRMGLEVQTTDNGQSAVEQAAASEFAAILMDLQMPGMDGFSATRAIRASGNTTPIIALSAAAMDKDRQAAEAAGMNDHVSKPIHPGQLAAVLHRWIPSGRPPAAPTAPERPAAGTGRLDLEHAAQALGGDSELLQRVLERFHADFVQTPEQLRAALDEGRLDDARRLVHTLKGLAPTLGSERLHQLAKQFEEGLQRQDRALQAAFEEELRAVLTTIAAACGIAAQPSQAPS